MDDNKRISYGSVNWLLFFNIILYVIITEAVIVINSYFSYERPDAYVTRIVVQIFAILLPLIIFTRSKNINFQKFYRFNKISPKNCAIIAVLGVSSQFIGTVLKAFSNMIFTVFKIPYSVESEAISVPDSGGKFLVAFIGLALLPALAEELLFRGLVVRSYEKWGTKSAIIISALLFGILHLDISSLLATIFMGLLLAYVVVKTDSILAGMLLHLVNNFTAIISILLVTKFPYVPHIIWLIIIIALIILFVPMLSLFNKVNIKSKHIPQKHSVSAELGRTIFTLPIMLSIIAFIIIQLYIFKIF